MFVAINVFTFLMDEDFTKTRNQTRVHYGQYAEALMCRKTYNISERDDAVKCEGNGDDGVR
jgi:hypothetical protein